MKEPSERKEGEVKDKIEVLKEKGIASFDVQLTEEERNSIKEIRIEKALPQFNYYGPVNEDLIVNLTAYFNQLEGNSEGIINTISKLITRISQGIQEEFNQETAWVMVRVTLPQGEYDKVARWHKDGKYVSSNYQDNEGNLSNGKLVFNIKGLPTRFAELKNGEDHQKKWDDLFQEEGNNYDKNYDKNKEEHEQSDIFKQEDLRIRISLKEPVEELSPFDNEHAVLYRTGDDNAKIHSEPKDNQKIAESRIFMSVVPGSTEDIEKFRQHYEKNK